MRSAGQEGSGSRAGDAVFRAAVADLQAGREAQRPVRPHLTFEDVAAPKRLAAIAAAVQAPGEDIEVGWGRLVLLYDPDGQEGWAGPFRVIAYIRAEVEPEIGADPLLGSVSWSWLTEALDAGAAGYAAPSGTVTRVITEGFGGKQDEPPTTGLEIRASWSPVERAGTPALAGHVTAWCDVLCAAAGLPTAPAGVRVMPQRGRRP
jgi:hypothetical protein